MKLSELIARLAEMLEEHGDVPVGIETSELVESVRYDDDGCVVIS